MSILKHNSLWTGVALDDADSLCCVCQIPRNIPLGELAKLLDVCCPQLAVLAWTSLDCTEGSQLSSSSHIYPSSCAVRKLQMQCQQGAWLWLLFNSSSTLFMPSSNLINTFVSFNGSKLADEGCSRGKPQSNISHAWFKSPL